MQHPDDVKPLVVKIKTVKEEKVSSYMEFSCLLQKQRILTYKYPSQPIMVQVYQIQNTLVSPKVSEYQCDHRL